MIAVLNIVGTLAIWLRANVLMMSCQLDMAGMGPESIEQLLADGISRAEALASLWQASSQEQQDSAPAASPPGLIRG